MLKEEKKGPFFCRGGGLSFSDGAGWEGSLMVGVLGGALFSM